MTLILPQRGRIGQAGGYFCNMTAGDFFGTIGYSTAFGIGSIDREPVPGRTVNSLLDSSGNFQFSFSSQLVTEIYGMKVYIDGVLYDPGGVFEMKNVGSGTTYANGSNNPPSAYGFVNTNSYFIEIK